jgi:M6 family metalloprotease-like protein
MSIPYFGKEFSFTQPDGTRLQVRGWGDQHQAAFETLDGYTVIKDPLSGFYQLAALSDDHEALVPTGVRPGLASPESLGLAKGQRISGAAARARHYVSGHLPPSKSRWEERRAERRMQVHAMAVTRGIAPAPPQHGTVGDYSGLTLLIQFPDVAATIPREVVEAFCNQKGYGGFGNNGSVYDYFFDNSAGKMRYTNVVTPYYTARYPRSYYTNPSVQQPRRTWELIKEALAYFKAKKFDFSKISTDGEGYIYALNVFYAGPCVNNWAEGLWPHSYHLLTPYKLAAGKMAFDYQITDMGAQLSLGTFCHENGHMVCDFPDLYDYGYESNGVGVFCLMCAGGIVDERNPVQICGYLRAHAGWSNVTKITQGLKATAGPNDVFIYEKSPSEYFMIENRYKDGRDAALPGSGLAIWHVDELGSNDNHECTKQKHYECGLEQADGDTDLEHKKNQGEADDLFRSGGKDRFDGTTKPGSQWWDGTSSGLAISEIGPSEKSMKFGATVRGAPVAEGAPVSP